VVGQVECAAVTEFAKTLSFSSQQPSLSSPNGVVSHLLDTQVVLMGQTG
jgi:hypothetical protein